mgnify:CR=1 FL=1
MNFKPLIEKALGELALILGSHADENTFQKWFENNPIVFQCMGYIKVIPHPRLESDFERNETYIPDFMALSSAGIWEVIEIKPAKAPIIKNTERRHSLRSTTESYLSQCSEYSELFRDTGYRHKFNERYGVDCHKTPGVTLVMGRSAGVDKKQLAEILSHRNSPHISIKTFDDVREQIYLLIDTVYDFPKEHSPGICVLFSAILLGGQGENFVIDLCKKGAKSQIQMYVQDNRIHVDVTDRSGNTFTSWTNEEDFRNVVGKYASFAIQVSNSRDYSSIDLIVDDVLILENRQRSLDFDFTDQLDQVIGSDQTGTRPSSMLFGGLIILKEIPLIEERWVLRTYLASMRKNEQGETYLLEFSGHKFLHTTSHPILGGNTPFAQCLIQTDESKKPMLRARFIDD